MLLSLFGCCFHCGVTDVVADDFGAWRGCCWWWYSGDAVVVCGSDVAVVDDAGGGGCHVVVNNDFLKLPNN